MRALVLLCLLAFTLTGSLLAQVRASLVSSQSSVAPGSRLHVALRLEHEDHWHSYWQNPGTGMPTQVQWTLPSGVSAGDLEWPVPIVLRDSEGAVSGHGYEGDQLLPLELTVPADLKPGTRLSLQASVRWLMCKEACVPGSAVLTLELPVAAQAVQDAVWSPRIAAARASVPKAQAVYPLFAYRQGATLLLDVTPGQGAAAPGSLGGLHFFPADETVDYEKPQPEEAVASGGRRLRLSVTPGTDPAALTRLTGVLRAEAGWPAPIAAKGVLVHLPIVAEPPAAAPVNAAAAGSLWATLGMALVGGLILNLMPCVFPVLGIKILGFVQQAGAERRKVVLHGLVFSAGVLISFWVLALGLLLLRSGGAKLGWGFQLQSPLFVAALAVVMLVFALNMSGLFEFGLSATSVGSDLQMKQGYAGSFFTGVLATLVATPCSAPFLAPALGAALALSPAESFLIFSTIAVGLSLPYLTLSVFPSLIRLLPRPGAWMESFKQAMAFPLYGTVAYLVWVLAGQLEDAQLLNLLLGLVLVAFALWDYGRHVQASRKAGWFAKLRVPLVVLLGLWIAWPGASTPKELQWEPWSAKRLEELRKEGRVVYVDFTARWCATCQTNKKVVFGSAETRALFQSRKVALLKADWTNSDPLITAELARWNRSAVPFNLVYLPGVNEPRILPELLTPGIVREALSP